MSTHGPLAIHPHQAGMTTLLVSMVILMVLTLITLTAGQIAVNDQRISNNEFRSQEALGAAESGIEQGLAYLRQNRSEINSSWVWTQCTAVDTDLPCGDGANNIYDENWLYIENIQNSLQAPNIGRFEAYYLTACRDIDRDSTCDASHLPRVAPVVHVVSKGLSEDESANIVIRQGFHFYPFASSGPQSPMMAVGTISGSGTFDVVTNPDGGAEGQPLSAWSDGDVSLGGSAKTCQSDEFLKSDNTYEYQTDYFGNTITMCASCSCPATGLGLISDSSTEGTDILDSDGNVGTNKDTTDFPDDIFEYVFGVPAADYLEVQKEAMLVGNCDSLDANSSGLIWVTGNCQPNNDVGSFREPALLVVEGDTTVNANLKLFAVIFAFSPAPTGTVTLDVKLNGGPTLYGAILSNQNIDMGNGTYRMRYDKNVISNLLASTAGNGIGKMSGSWADFQRGTPP